MVPNLDIDGTWGFLVCLVAIPVALFLLDLGC
jgi:hypothetical protein